MKKEKIILAPPTFGVRIEEIKNEAFERIYDTFMSGTLIDPYHNDKSEILVKLLENDKITLKIINGHLNWINYQYYLNRSKTIVCHYRNTGGFLTRALDALKCGSIPICPDDNVTTLFFEIISSFTYKHDFSNLNNVLEKAIKFHKGEETSLKLSENSKKLEYKKISSKYMRYLVLQASLIKKNNNKNNKRRKNIRLH